MYTIRKCIREMSGYVPGEASIDLSVVKLNQNENRYPPSEKAVHAMREAIPMLPFYPDSSSRSLREAAARIYNVHPDEVMANNGSDEMLRLLLQVCCDPGDEVVAFYPSYTYYATLAAMHDANYRLIDFEGDFRIPSRLELANAKLVLLPNPNSPTGTTFPESEIRRLIEATTNGVVAIDEAYADFCGVTAIPLLREYENLVVVRTFSKSYGLAGLRAGLGFGRRELLAEIDKVRDYFNLDRLAQAGAEAALVDTAWLAETTRKIQATRARVADAARALGLTVFDGGGNFLLMRLSGPEKAEAVFQDLRRQNVLVRYFKSRRLADCLRVSIGTDRDMDTFLAALERSLANV